MKYITIWMLIFLTLSSLPAIAAQVSVEVIPQNPLAGESFNLLFKISTDSSEEPDISFNPIGAEVQGRESQGVSIKTMFVNGRLSTSREVSYAYEMLAPKATTVRISDIKVEVGGRTLTHPSITIPVLNEPREQTPIFVQAVTDKNSAYVGEGLTARYYLYNRVSVTGTDIKEFPKLNNFLKRYFQEEGRTERVQYNGEIYNRTLIYSARLYPERIGKLHVDPLTIRAQYAVRDTSDPFGGFGLGLAARDLKIKNVSSKSLEIDVKRLPTENVPSHFSGLIGKHEFNIEFNKTKFLVNEPIEIKLKVTGPGALENYEGPKVLNNPNLEEFEANGELNTQGANVDVENLTKTFQYTYITRGPFRSAATTLPISYFDPASASYVTVNLNIPEIIVEGTAVSGGAGPTNFQKSEEKADEKASEIDKFIPKLPQFELSDKGSGVVGPIFAYDLPSSHWIQYLCIGLALIASFLAIKRTGPKNINGLEGELKKLMSEMNQKGVDYSTLNRFFSSFKNFERHRDMEEIVRNSRISDNNKKYFYKLIHDCEQNQFTNQGKTSKKDEIKFKKDAFLELIKELSRTEKHDDTEESFGYTKG